jgi:serine/threonine protein kinase/class 3 adenylate cyclase
VEWVEGPSLADALAKETLTPEERRNGALDLAGAVAAAHRLGLSHGRLRPASVRLTANRRLKLDVTATDTQGPWKALSEPDPTYQAPEVHGTTADFAADVYSLGKLVGLLLATRTDEPGIARDFVSQMLSDDPAARPSAQEAHAHLSALLIPLSTPTLAVTAVTKLQEATLAVTIGFEAKEVLPRQRLGRFRLLEKLGEGGMGAVYRAEDEGDGAVVAIKVLRPDLMKHADALRRFHKEARLLAEVNNPHVTNLLEVNEDKGVHYLVLEFVAGQTLSDYLKQRGRLNEDEALAIMADVCRALVDAHRRGIVHRDVKPENILLGGLTAEGAEERRGRPGRSSASSSAPSPVKFTPKLSDFGLARHIVESESLNVTRAGAILGTPYYMPPEQCSGHGTVDARSDVYSLGATLFHLLAGRPPFLAPTTQALIAMHCRDAPPSLQKLNDRLSDGVCRLVEKALAKEPEHRYADAEALLRDLERLQRGEPSTMVVHPRLPACDPARLIQYDWSWDLQASPAQLWPYVSNTERLNRAVSLPSVEFTAETDEGGRVRRFGRFRKLGVTASWREHPFEWVEGRRFGVLREYEQGPFSWLVSLVELAPRPGGGTTLSHRVHLEPNGLLGRTVAAVEVAIKGRRAVERVYHRIDAAVTGRLGSGLVDPFEETPSLPRGQRRRLDQLLDRLTTCGLNPLVVDRLGDFLAHASPQEVARIRPLALARRLGVDPDQLVAACLHGAREGLFDLLWDLLCPICRIPSDVRDTLRDLRQHGHCPACNLDFELDFAGSVEMIFRAHPTIRDADLGTYCIGGPAHSPHVVAQVRLAPAEHLELELALGEGAYRLRGPQLPYTVDFVAQPGARAARAELNLARAPGPEFPRQLRPGGQLLALTNDHTQELVVRVERTASRADALTAARASSLALFRDLFPGEVLSLGQLVSVATVTLLNVEVDQAAHLYEKLGDARAFDLLYGCFRLLEQHIRQCGGAVVKTVGEGIVAVFSEPLAAVRTVLVLRRALADNGPTRAPPLRASIHRGPALAATLNDRLDYFGTTINQAAQLVRLAQAGELVLSDAVTSDPAVAELLQSAGLSGELQQADLTGQPGVVVQRLRMNYPSGKGFDAAKVRDGI